MKILLVGHAICPNKGSELGLTWNWAWHLSAAHDVWVIAHPEFKATVESYLVEHPNSRLHIVWLKGSRWDPSKGQRGVRLHYLRWLKQSVQVAKRLHDKIVFDIIHHVSLATISAPPKLWTLRIPFVWGPVGGAQVCPPSLVALFREDCWIEYLRRIRINLLPFFPALRAAVSHSAAVLASNQETVALLRAAGAAAPILFVDNGIADNALPDRPRFRKDNEIVRVFWASKFEKRKALGLALESLREVDSRVRLELHVAGGGVEGAYWKAQSTALGLDDRVVFLGELNSGQMRDQFQNADIFLFTSIRDSCASVVLEAMSFGLPVITLNLHGVGDYMPESAGIKVPVGSRETTVKAIAAALSRLAADPQLREACGQSGWEYAREQCWSKRAEKMTAIYQELVPSGLTGGVEQRVPWNSAGPEGEIR